MKKLFSIVLIVLIVISSVLVSGCGSVENREDATTPTINETPDTAIKSDSEKISNEKLKEMAGK